MLGFVLFFFNDTATTEIYTLSLHDALPISSRSTGRRSTSSSSWRAGPRTTTSRTRGASGSWGRIPWPGSRRRSEEHTSELQSRQYLVCRLLLEKKKKSISHRDTHCCSRRRS